MQALSSEEGIKVNKHLNEDHTNIKMMVMIPK